MNPPKKFQSVTCAPQQVAEVVTDWDLKGYSVDAMAGISSGVGNGHGPLVVILFRAKGSGSNGNLSDRNLGRASSDRVPDRAPRLKAVTW